MMEDKPVDPDELLKAIQKEENQNNTGKLKIFFGMSAGVGKTYGMLQEAQARLKEGVDIVVGTINTHGRKETEALLQGMPMVPEKWVNYKETVFEEMDLEAILQLKPSIVLVDELAHTNIPGSRHPKRWQDVVDLLDAGIDVYTTLNVQHVESRKDLVESFALIQIRETVPDSLLERASSIELIDLSPSALLQRLNEGKVYLGNQSQIAARNFFKEGTLTALREIALRFTAEKVDHDLHSILSQGKGWKTREKLMVAISSSPFSQQLIRRTRRRAFEQDAPWIVVYVDTGKILSDEEQSRLTQHLNLAQELGAEVIVTDDTDVASALQRIAKQKNITQLVMGRSTSGPNWTLFHKSLMERLEEENQQLDLLILRQDRLTKVYQSIYSIVSLRSPFYSYALALASILGSTIVGFLMLPLIGDESVGFIFLLGIVLLSFFVGPGPVFLAAILSTWIWKFFFIPPTFSLSMDHPEDLALILIYFCTATIIGLLTSRIHKQDALLKGREKKLQQLYEIEQDLTSAVNFPQLRQQLTHRLQAIFNGQFDILISSENNQFLILDSRLAPLQEEKEQVVAQWVFRNRKMAGWSTSTLSAAKALYLPIKISHTTLGVLVYYPKSERLLSLTEMHFLQTVAQHIGIYLDKFK